ncbi:MAG: hypothetical protein IJ083_14070 [Clostridia bacterium]|nr:hypothetical protein [Clostridia bacterium]
MGKAFYTNISFRQVYVIRKHVEQGHIHLSETMLRYLDFIQIQGGGPNKSTIEEDFRARIFEGVGELMHEQYDQAQQTFDQAFRHAMACWSSDMLDEIRRDRGVE